MSTSTTPDVPRDRSPTTVSRYDLVLAIIPAAFVVALLASVFLSLPLRTVLPASSLVGVLALADSLYLNPPTDGV